MLKLKSIFLTLILTVLSFHASAALYLKSSGDQWSAAIQDLQLSYNEGVSSNTFTRFYNTLSGRFNLDGSSAEDILNAFKNGTDTSSQTSFNTGLTSGSGGSTGGNSSSYVSNDDFKADQKRQDDASAQVKEEQKVRDQGQDDHITAVQGAAQTANDRATNLEQRADSTESNLRDTNAQLEVTDKRSQNNSVRLDGVEQKNTQQDIAINSKVDKTVFKEDQDRQDAALSAETTSRVAGDAYVNKRVDAANVNIEANRQSLNNTNKIVSQNTADIANHEERIQHLEGQTNSRFANIDKRIDENKQKADAAIAGVAAMANIPQVTESARFSVGAGLGTRGNEQAVAVGMSSRLSYNVVGKLSVASDTQQQWTAGVGVAVQW